MGLFDWTMTTTKVISQAAYPTSTRPANVHLDAISTKRREDTSRRETEVGVRAQRW